MDEKTETQNAKIIDVRVNPLLPYFYDAILALEKMTEIVDAALPKDGEEQ